MAVKISLLLFLLVPSVFAQVKIKNPKHLPVPQDKVQIIFETTCRVVAEGFHARYSHLQFPLVLVLGEENERYSADEETGTYTIYLRDWNPIEFANSAMHLAVQRLIPAERRSRMLSVILSRSNAIAPISVEEARKPDTHSDQKGSVKALARGVLPRP